MIVYKIFYKNYHHKQRELIGVLKERRRDSRGLSHFESGMKWAKFSFSHMVEDKQRLFAVPKVIGEGTEGWLV